MLQKKKIGNDGAKEKKRINIIISFFIQSLSLLIDKYKIINNKQNNDKIIEGIVSILLYENK